MADLLQIGTNAARAYRTALETVGDNVANAATEGYQRRRAVLGSGPTGAAETPLRRDLPGPTGSIVEGIARAADMWRAGAMRGAASQEALFATQADRLSALQSIVARDGGMGRSLGAFFDAASELAADPLSTALRRQFLGAAEVLAGRFNDAAAALAAEVASIDAASAQGTSRVEQLAGAIADLNRRLRLAAPDSVEANLLLDERDRLVGDVAKLVGVEVRTRRDGSSTLLTEGVVLVEGADAAPLRPSSGRLLIGEPPAEVRPRAGMLGGLVVARSWGERLTVELDQLAARFAAMANAVHGRGSDLDGQPTGDLFEQAALVATPARGNGGSLRAIVSLAEGAEPVALDLSYDAVAGRWSLSRQDGSDQMSGTLPLSLAGVTVDVDGMPLHGDVIRIGPSGSALGLRLAVDAVAGIGTALRWIAIAGEFETDLVVEPQARPSAHDALRLTAGGDLLDLAGGLIASPGPDGWTVGPGFRVRPRTGATTGEVRIVRAGAANADPSVASALAALRDGAGGETFEAASDRLIGGLATALAAARAAGETARTTFAAATRAHAEATGVDLDREAAELLAMQQAYQASTRIVATARTVFDSILEATR